MYPSEPDVWERVGNCPECGAPLWLRGEHLSDDTMPLHSRSCLAPCKYAFGVKIPFHPTQQELEGVR